MQRHRLTTGAIQSKRATSRTANVAFLVGAAICVGGFVLIFSGCENAETAKTLAIELLKVLGGLALIAVGSQICDASTRL